jgi:hypothetical protein
VSSPPLGFSNSPTRTPQLSRVTEPSPLAVPSNLVSQDVAVELVELYIRYMHDKPHALFHEPSLREAVVSGSVAQVVLLSIMGLAAR